MTNFSGENLNSSAGPQGERRDSASNKYQAYPEYKDSGVTWLGEIPDHWIATRIKHIGMLKGGAGFPHDEQGVTDQELDLHKVNALGKAGSEGFLEKSENTISLETAKKLGAFVFPERSIVFAKVGAALLLGRIRWLKYPSCLDNNMMGLVVRSIYDSRYIKHAMSIVKFDYVVNPGAIPSLNEFQMGNLFLGVPTLSEQQTIANFLDHETAKIDTLIEQQQKLIQLLKEKRQAVISHAVTKGLNPNAPMKDSGVEWLGEVPEHWVCKSYRYACQIYRGKFGHRPRNDPAFYDGDYPFIQTGDVAQAGKYITEYKQTLNEKGKAVSQLFPAGTLVMTIAANIGDTAILSFEAYAPDSIVGFKPREDIDLEFLRYSLMAALPALVQTSTQSTQANLNIERVGAVQAAFPTKDVQKEIVKLIDQTLDKFDRIERQAVNGVEILQERRTALISAAVTGKIDVRGWQAPSANQ